MSSVAEKLGRKAPRPPSNRQVRVKLTRLYLLSVAKISALFGLAIGVLGAIVLVVAWMLLSSFGALHQLDLGAANILGTANSASISSIFTLGTVLGISALLALVDVIFWIIAGTVAAALYNLSVKMTHGIFIGFNNR